MADYPFAAEALLPDLKLDLGISARIFDGRLQARLKTAMERIAAEGVTLTDSENDRDLVLMYAAWLWRSRVTGDAMPRMVRSALNNRVFHDAAGGGAP